MEDVDWFTAEAYCKKNGSFNQRSQTLVKYITTFLKSLSDPWFWIGMIKNHTNTDFYNADCELSNFFPALKNLITTSNAYECIVAAASNTTDLIDVRSCREKHPYICYKSGGYISEITVVHNAFIKPSVSAHVQISIPKVGYNTQNICIQKCRLGFQYVAAMFYHDNTSCFLIKDTSARITIIKPTEQYIKTNTFSCFDTSLPTTTKGNFG
ncbi:CD206 [Mytilus edulis]|uniref:MRC n=1 Tax=Mytilus edulis TaxID=6550 RepID=A0A8S3RBM0_MYTED|nr:CD206 [Mytilus edulis]